MRRAPRATLIQHIGEFQQFVKPALDLVLERFAHDGVTYEDALEWILAEELELIFGLFDTRHQDRRSCSVYGAIYSQVQQELAIPLSRLVSHYIAAPRVYEDNVIDIKVVAMDLYTIYHRDAYTQIVHFPEKP